MTEIEYYISKIPNHLVIEKCLWVNDVFVDIDHTDNDLDKPLDYLSAFRKMADKLDVVAREPHGNNIKKER